MTTFYVCETEGCKNEGISTSEEAVCRECGNPRAIVKLKHLSQEFRFGVKYRKDELERV
ncbi:MAG: hypothetical protein LBC03_03405 [Nitrososphaerota archaeon]|jgi:DNA-directed RNA polymerase subunit RPC12/RpoP|nr:hypothetical protein [Nitrososphaerota archaeon]